MVACDGEGRRYVPAFFCLKRTRRGVIYVNLSAVQMGSKFRAVLPPVVHQAAAIGLLLRMDVLAEFPGQFRRTPKMVNEKLFFSGVLPPMGQIRLVHRCFLSFCVCCNHLSQQPDTGQEVPKALGASAPIFRQRSYKLPISSSFISYILSHFNEPFKKLF